MRQERLGVLVVAEFGAKTLSQTGFSVNGLFATLSISETQQNNSAIMLSAAFFFFFFLLRRMS